MLRKGPSRSFVEKPPLPAVLPPLQKKNTAPEETQQKNPNTTRQSNFVIRKKAPSFIDNYTTRKPVEQKYQTETKKSYKKSKPPNVIANLNNTSICQNQSFQNRIFKKIDSNIQHNISICKIQLQQVAINQKQFQKNKQQLENTNSQHMFEKIDTAKSIIKKSSKKRKIQQCKTRKINWGPKNGVFDLGISIIKQDQSEEVNNPIQSLQQLYAQIF